MCSLITMNKHYPNQHTCYSFTRGPDLCGRKPHIHISANGLKSEQLDRKAKTKAKISVYKIRNAERRGEDVVFVVVVVVVVVVVGGAEYNIQRKSKSIVAMHPCHRQRC